MTLEHKTVSQLEQMIVAARETEEASKAALVVNDRRVYADDVHAERVQAIETERRQAIAEVEAEINRRLAEIDQQLLPVDRDPLLGLAPDELTRASALAPFVREDIETGNIAPKLRAVLKSGDKASQAIWLRYLSGPDERGLSRWDGEVQELVKQLETIVRPPDGKQDELKARQKRLLGVMTKEVTQRYLDQAYGRR